jgi:hypothetical protein
MAVGIRSSSTMRSSLRSVSSRRRRTSERLLSEVIDFTASEEEAPAGGLGHAWLGPQLAERIEFDLFTLRRWESPSGRYRLSRSNPPTDLFICAGG